MSGLHFVRTGIPDTPKTPLSASSFHEYYSDTPRHHPDIPKTTPRHLQGTQDVNRRQHAPTDTSEHTQKHLSVSEGVCWALLSSVVVCCRLLISWVPWRCLGGYLGVVWGYLRGIHGNWRHSDVFEGYLGFQSLQYGALTLFRHSPETHNFFCLTILRHQNIKMSIYKVYKNHWVIGFFCFLVPIRKKW